MTSPRCSVVIRCCNEEKHIERLLTGLAMQTVCDVETIVVDSGSTDATLDIVSRYPVKLLNILPEHFSFGRSLNLGCQSALAPYVVFASAHVYPAGRGWLEAMLAPFADPDVALVYGRQRGDGRTKYSEHQIFAKWFPRDPEARQDLPFCNNANAAIRRALWKELPFDESLTGLEDIDWAKRMMAKGNKGVYAPEAEVVHVHEESCRLIYRRYQREAIALKQIFPHERFSLADFIHLYAANVASDLMHARRQGVVWANLPGIVTFRLMQFWGTYRGFARHKPVTSRLKQTFYYPHVRKQRPERAGQVKGKRPGKTGVCAKGKGSG